MYDFILNQWILGNFDATRVNKCVPKWIDQKQADAILATPQVS
ncbi:hypothetical protein [Aminipila luticellarii]|nr:hypothetical protein [Aminipila luticellarii]